MMRKAKRFPSRRKRSRFNVYAVLERLRKEYGVEPLKTVKLNAMKKALVAVNGDRRLAAELLNIGKTSINRHFPALQLLMEQDKKTRTGN